MFRSVASRPRRSSRGRAGVVLLAAALAASAFTATAAGAAVGAGKQKVDRDAVLRFGAPIEEQGGVFFDPSSPRAAANPTSRMWMDLIYGTMIRQTADGTGAPGLATEWTTPDANTVELTLREGVTFADGTPFDAHAVKAAWDRFIASDRPNKSTDTQALESVEVLDDYRVRLNLSAPLAKNYVDDVLKNAVHLGVPSPTAAAAGNLDEQPVGAGPYRLASYETGRIVLERNPEYYDPKAQKLAGYEFIDVGIGPPGVSALQSGRVDLIWSFPPDAIATLEADPNLEVFSAPSARQYQVSLCPTQGVFASKPARQAIQYAVDREAIDAGALDGTGEPGQTILTNTSPYFNEKLAKTYRYNPKKARALLREAGVAEGTTVSMLVPSQPPYPAIAEIVQDQLADVGLDVEITLTTSFASDAGRLKPDMMTVSMDPTLLALIFQNESPLNPCGWADPEVIAAMNATLDPTKSEAELQEAWDAFQEIVLDESANIVTNAQGLLAAHTDKVKGLKIINSPYGPQLDTVYMVE